MLETPDTYAVAERSCADSNVFSNFVRGEVVSNHLVAISSLDINKGISELLAVKGVTPWQNTKPDNSFNSNCVSFNYKRNIGGASDGLWEDISCTEIRPALCEVKFSSPTMSPTISTSQPPIKSPSTSSENMTTNGDIFEEDQIIFASIGVLLLVVLVLLGIYWIKEKISLNKLKKRREIVINNLKLLSS